MKEEINSIVILDEDGLPDGKCLFCPHCVYRDYSYDEDGDLYFEREWTYHCELIEDEHEKCACGGG